MTTPSRKTWFVTGAARGLGAAIARAALDADDRVVVAGRNRDALVEAFGPDSDTVLSVTLDVTDAATIAAAVEATVARFGRIDVLVNNAGITRDGLLVRMSDDDWRAVLDTNLSGAFYLSRAAGKLMMKQRSGSIINISSVVGVMGNAGQANYAAAKAGLIGLTKSVARELAGRGVRANAVAPGFIATDMTDALPVAARDAATASIAMGRLGSPEDIAATVAFLASDDASYITGQVIAVDGGMTFA